MAYDFGHVRRSEMRVVFLRDARIGVSELISDDTHRHTFRSQSASVGVAQYVKRARRLEARSRGGSDQRSLLM